MKSIFDCFGQIIKRRLMMAAASAALAALAIFQLAPSHLRQYMEPRAQAATFVVTNTSSSGPGSLSQAIVLAQMDQLPDSITFNIPPSDQRHFYYRNDNAAGTVSQSMIAATTADDDAQIPDIDPDWPHSWYSIETGISLIQLTTPMTIDGLTQPGAVANSNANGGLNSVLRVEITNNQSDCAGIFRNFTAPIIYRGLIINRCSQNSGSKLIDFEVNSDGSAATGSYLGTDPSGTIALGGGYGAHVTRSSGVTVGGNSPADRNLISGNFRGLNINNGGISGSGFSNVRVIGNLIGTKRDGVSPLGNGFHPSFPTFPEDGVVIGVTNGFTSNNRVENNVIAFNARYGIHIGGGGVGTTNTIIDNRISGNSIHSNGNIGINLDGNDQGANVDPVTPNDVCDADTGVNALQNYPVLNSTAVAGSSLTIRGALNSAAGGSYTIQFFSSPLLDPRGFGEGRTFLGSTTVNDSDNDCLMEFSASVPRPAAGETIITSTATDAAGNTSEFSASVRVNNAPFDFDGDLESDLAVFRPSTGDWWTRRSSDSLVTVGRFGLGSDRIVPSDYTGDGKTDLAVFRPSTSEWFILRSENFSYYAFPFGNSGDVPVPADYDGDGRADAAVWRPSTGTWYVLNSFNGSVSILPFGRNGDQPAPADYTGDGKTDLAVFRPEGANGGEWWMRLGLAVSFPLGAPGDVPVAADYDGDGRADAAVWRPSTGEWFIRGGETIRFGTAGDLPVPADYGGDGMAEIAVFRPNGFGGGAAEWWLRAGGLASVRQFGLPGDVPAPAAFAP